MTWLLLVLAAAWFLLAANDLMAVRHLTPLPSPRPSAPPSVTVVMAVRDDAEHVEASVQRILAQQHIHHRVVVVDDRSRDGTGEILARLAEHEPRLIAHSVAELPDGWLGKSHALHIGTANVDTDWILFTDGDAQLAPDAIARAIAAADRTAAAHVCLLPNHRDTTFLGRACLLAFQLSVLRRVRAVNRDHPRAFVGTGAFNLVRSDAYRRIGGHLPLRLEVVDDVWMGCLLRRAGYRSRVWLGADLLAIDWGRTPRDLVRVVAKNMFAVLRYRTALAALAVAGSLVALAFTFAAPLWFGPLGWLPLLAWCSSAVAGAMLARRMRWECAAGLLTPLTRFLLPLAMANSMWTTLRQGGVRWRDTFYPLPLLRAGQVR
jgi:cellulose synthase/poly-beta-1,6-N-acetylglucosamine synthase-like glycosyltransferase